MISVEHAIIPSSQDAVRWRRASRLRLLNDLFRRIWVPVVGEPPLRQHVLKGLSHDRPVSLAGEPVDNFSHEIVELLEKSLGVFRIFLDGPLKWRFRRVRYWESLASRTSIATSSLSASSSCMSLNSSSSAIAAR